MLRLQKAREGVVLRSQEGSSLTGYGTSDARFKGGAIRATRQTCDEISYEQIALIREQTKSVSSAQETLLGLPGPSGLPVPKIQIGAALLPVGLKLLAFAAMQQGEFV